MFSRSCPGVLKCFNVGLEIALTLQPPPKHACSFTLLLLVFDWSVEVLGPLNDWSTTPLQTQLDNTHTHWVLAAELQGVVALWYLKVGKVWRELKVGPESLKLLKGVMLLVVLTVTRSCRRF